ncbi:MAG: hypothetical protein ACK45H_11670 [Bacteroidota bacterium]|jgi:hypothetical protein
MFSNLPLYFKKFSVPVLFFIMGLLLLFAGIKGEQNSMFLLSSLMMFLAGALSIVYSSGVLSIKVLYILGASAGAASLVIFVLSYNSVDETATYNKNYALCRGKSIANLEDIRYIQKAHAERFGRYAKTWEELVAYTKTGTVPFVVSEGVVPGRKITEAERDYLIQFGLYKANQAIDFNMTEKEAYYLSKWANSPEDLKGFKRDTVQRSLLEMRFKNKAYVDGRMKAGYGKFYPDSLPYVPLSGASRKWKLETVDSLQIGEDKLPAMKVSGKIPFAKIQGKADEELWMGSLTAPDIIGSWEEE